MKIRQQLGVSLIELMVALVIGLVLILGATQIFLSGRVTYAANSALSRVQESGRFASEFLAYDIRNSGYRGPCISSAQLRLNLSGQSEAFKYDVNIPVYGRKESSVLGSGNNKLAGTQSLLIKYAGAGQKFYGSSSNSINSQLDIQQGVAGYQEAVGSMAGGKGLVVSSSAGCDVFENSQGQSSIYFSQKGSGGNHWSDNYTGHFEVYPLVSQFYYVGENDARPPSLYRKDLSTFPAADSEELVEGVVELQFEYGIDKNDDRIVDEYVGLDELNSDADWERVLSVRFYMIVVSPEKNVFDENIEFHLPILADSDRDDDFVKYSNGKVTVKDRRAAQVFTSTVGIRNRLP